jgi:hypothetical protein
MCTLAIVKAFNLNTKYGKICFFFEITLHYLVRADPYVHNHDINSHVAKCTVFANNHDIR